MKIEFNKKYNQADYDKFCKCAASSDKYVEHWYANYSFNLHCKKCNYVIYVDNFRITAVWFNVYKLRLRWDKNGISQYKTNSGPLTTIDIPASKSCTIDDLRERLEKLATLF